MANKTVSMYSKRAVKKPAGPTEDLVGLTTKYLVFKLENFGKGLRWAQKETPSFVLSPNKPGPYGHASRKALLAYARSIQKTNPKLAEDLRNWIAEAEREA